MICRRLLRHSLEFTVVNIYFQERIHTQMARVNSYRAHEWSPSYFIVNMCHWVHGNDVASFFGLYLQGNQTNTASQSQTLYRLLKGWTFWPLPDSPQAHVYTVNQTLSSVVMSDIFRRMMTSCHGNVFCITGPLWGGPQVTGAFPTQKTAIGSSEVSFDACLNKKLSKHSNCWWFKLHGSHFYRITQKCLSKDALQKTYISLQPTRCPWF